MDLEKRCRSHVDLAQARTGDIGCPPVGQEEHDSEQEYLSDDVGVYEN